MSQIATVELIYVARSGRQYRAQHKQVHTGWELDDLKSQAKSNLSLRDYAIEFTNVNGHTQYIMPTDLETIIVNVVAVTEERWEEPDYEALQQRWTQSVKPYGETETASERTQETPAPPNPDRVRATATALMSVKPKLQTPETSPSGLPGNEDTQSIKVTWPTAPRPQQYVNWPRQNGKSDAMANDETRPLQTIDGETVGISEEDATAVIERIAAGGSVTPGS
jgi:hypothetical protein